jgi:hypothetical protein
MENGTSKTAHVPAPHAGLFRFLRHMRLIKKQGDCVISSSIVSANQQRRPAPYSASIEWHYQGSIETGLV